MNLSSPASVCFLGITKTSSCSIFFCNQLFKTCTFCKFISSIKILFVIQKRSDTFSNTALMKEILITIDWEIIWNNQMALAKLGL